MNSIGKYLSPIVLTPPCLYCVATHLAIAYNPDIGDVREEPSSDVNMPRRRLSNSSSMRSFTQRGANSVAPCCSSSGNGSPSQRIAR